MASAGAAVGAGVIDTRCAGSQPHANTSTSTSITANAGAMAHANCFIDSAECCHSKRFCGLPIGLRVEPAFTASASSTTMRNTGRLHSAPSVSVSGTIRNRLTSLVSSIDSSALAATSSRPSVRTECARTTSAHAARCTRPLSRTPWMATSSPSSPARVGHCVHAR